MKQQRKENPDSDPVFTKLLIKWYRTNARRLPWRENRDPYRVWLSEIMLQQTRVETVIPYYSRFLKAIPDMETLASAEEEKLFKLWEGLGYYSRARNLKKAAQIIVSRYGGRFPDSYAEIRALPGIGPYTAGAVASICFGHPVPAVDGNVLRVMSRIEGICEPVDNPQVKKRVASALEKLYPQDEAGDFTQSLMELGATLCTPGGNPKCPQCPVSRLCSAFHNGTVSLIPVKSPRKKREVQQRTLWILHCRDRLALRRRSDRGLLAGMWEFPNREGVQNTAEALAEAEKWGTEPVGIIKTVKKKHVFTHLEWHITCHHILCRQEADAFTWIGREELEKNRALPTAMKKCL